MKAWFVFVALFVVLSAGAVTHRVWPGRYHDTIQEAIDVAADGDEIRVYPGVYNLGSVDGRDGTKTRVYVHKAVRIYSVDGPRRTIIEGMPGSQGLGEGAVRCAYLAPGAILQGFTLRNGYTSGNRFEESGRGGGAVVSPGAWLADCIIANCHGAQSGGVHVDGGTLYNCLIRSNVGEVGGVDVGFGTLRHCTISMNESSAEAVRAYKSTIDSCIIWGNRELESWEQSEDGNLHLDRSTIQYSCVLPLQDGVGNIEDDPDFSVSPAKLKRGSPCENTGNPAQIDAPERLYDTSYSGLRKSILNMGYVVGDGVDRIKTHYVDSIRGDDRNSGRGWSTAFQTLQRAIDRASEGDLVLVTNGVYRAGGDVVQKEIFGSHRSYSISETNRACIDKLIKVQSVNGPTRTFIEGWGSRCVYLGPDAILEGFTLEHGRAAQCGGGAVLRRKAQLKNCIVADNEVTDFGDGGGVISFGGRVENCLLTDNSAVDGGGVYALQHSLLQNCTLVRNDGSGAFLEDSLMRNCIAWDNWSYWWEMGNIEASESVIEYSCTTPLQPGEGNIAEDPLLAANSIDLQEGSPCIDSAFTEVFTSYDLRGALRPVDGNLDAYAYSDMGCAEWIPSVSLYCVDAGRPDDLGDGKGWDNAKKTIQAAVDQAQDGDRILVTNGIYNTGGAYAAHYDGGSYAGTVMNRISVDKAITIRSVNGPLETIIEGASDPRGTAGHGPEAVRCALLQSNAVLEGFTLRHGRTAGLETMLDRVGGGACLLGGASLNRCIVKQNGSSLSGGGVYAKKGYVNDCLISNNDAGYDGGGAFVSADSVLSHCTITANTARRSGGVFLTHWETLYNSVVWGNTAREGIYNEINDLRFKVRNTCTAPLQEGDGNIEADPLFAGDQGLRYGSPCIDAGDAQYTTLSVDLLGRDRFADGAVDMGCFEYDAARSDSNLDGISDDWYLTYGLDCTNPAESSEDPDNDQQTNYEEYIAGCDPSDETSYFGIEAFSTFPQNCLEWTGVPGRTYSVYWSTNLLEGFELLESDIPWTRTSYIDTVHGIESRGFYQLGVELQ